LLRYLAAHPGRVFTRTQLLQEVWGYDYYGGTRTVDVHVRRLRAKLGPENDQLIGTVRNVGYRFDPPKERRSHAEPNAHVEPTASAPQAQDIPADPVPIAPEADGAAQPAKPAERSGGPRDEVAQARARKRSATR
jgi:DNA-binding winged helix-turn-helix (wHTH) protein